VLTNGYRYSATANGFASSYSSSWAKSAIALNDGSVRFYTDTAVTTAAGTDVTPTERARIDSSGNVGIGTTSPAAKLEVVAGTGSKLVGTFRTGDATAANNAGGGFEATSSATAGSRNARIWLDADGANFSGSDYFYIDKTGGSGNVAFIQQSTAAMTFATDGTERVRIDSIGQFMVNKTTTSGNSAITAKSFGTDSYQGFNSNNAFTFAVSGAGIVYAVNTTISAISDQRLKENIQDLDVGLNAVMQLKPRKFDWKEDKGKNIKGDRGWVAQEFEQVFPDMIDEWRDPAPEGEEPYKSVRADLIPVLVKAIQELKAIVDAQGAEIAALKGTP